MKITGKFILAFAIAAMSMDLFAADQPPVCALYKAVLPPNAHPKLVDTVEIAVGPPEAGEPNLLWFRVACTKVNKDAFTIWFLADGNPFSAHSNRTINFVRYILQEPGRTPIEYVEQRSGRALLPLFYFREKLLPRSTVDSNEPLFEKGSFLGHPLIRSAQGAAAPQVPPTVTFGGKLVLNPELLIGTGRNFKDDGAGRKSPTDNYNYVPFTPKDYNDMIDAGVNYFTARGQQIDWICRRAVFYEGYSPGIAFPEELFRSNFMGLVMFIDEPACILAGKYPKDASPIEAVKMIQQHILQQRDDRSYMKLLREAGIDLGSLELIEPCIPIWETYVDTSYYQLEANPCGIVQECRWQIRPDGSEQTSGRFLQRINAEFGTDIPIEPKNLFIWSYSQMIGPARALGAKWGMAIYGQAEPELRLPSMKLAYDLGAAFIWFWTSDHDHHVPYDEQLALVRAITEYAKSHPRPPLNEVLRRARAAVVLPYGYTLPTCWELDMFGSYIFPMSRKNQFGITYKQVLNPAIKEIETLLKNNIPYDVVPASSRFDSADYDEVIRVEENGAVRKLTDSIAGMLSPSVFADEGARAEKERWVAARFGRADANVPFSFLYNGQPSSKLLKDWKAQHSSRPLDENRTEYVVTHSDPQTGLVVRCMAVEYKDFPTVEWTLYFKNAGTSDTPILSEIQTLDAHFGFKSAKGIILHHSKGGFDLPPTETFGGKALALPAVR